jgi:hypothetical protein
MSSELMLLAVETAAGSAVVQMQMLAWVAGAATMHVICSRHGLCFSLEYNCKLQLLQLLTSMINPYPTLLRRIFAYMHCRQTGTSK